MNIGDQMPPYLGVDETGKEWHSKDLLGSWWVLYCYPKDNTSGCTAQAQSLRDAMVDFEELGIPIIGVSKDSAKSHIKFKEKHELPFPLIADTETRLLQTLGVWVEKSMYGRTYMGTQRTTFVVDPTGLIAHKMQGREIKTKEHASQLLSILKSL